MSAFLLTRFSFAFALLGVAICVVTLEQRVDLLASGAFPRDIVCERSELVVLVVQRGSTQTQRPNKLWNGKWPLFHFALAELSEHILTSLLDRASRIASTDVGERAQRELILQRATQLLDEGAPHQPARGVVREWEVYSVVEELLEFLLVAVLRLGRAPDNRDLSLVGEPFGSLPLCHGFGDTVGVGHVVLFRFLLALLLLFFARPDFLCLVDVDQRGHVLLSHNKDHGDHFLGALSVVVEFSVDVHR